MTKPNESDNTKTVIMNQQEKNLRQREKDISKREREISDKVKQLAHAQSYAIQLENRIKELERNDKVKKTRLACVSQSCTSNSS